MTQEQKVEKYIKERGGILELVTKRKKIYALDNDNILLVFEDKEKTDSENGKATNKIIWQKGLGSRNVGISTYFYEEITKNLNIPTHIVESNVELGIAEVKRANALAKGLKFGRDKKGNKYISNGLEFVVRNKAFGSFLTRYPNIHKMQDLRTYDKQPFIEVAVKNEEAGNPFFALERLVIMGVDAVHLNTAIKYAEKIGNFLTGLFASNGLELLDMKMEFGIDKNSNVILIDEISPGSLRASQNGVMLTKDQIYEIFMK